MTAGACCGVLEQARKQAAASGQGTATGRVETRVLGWAWGAGTSLVLISLEPREA